VPLGSKHRLLPWTHDVLSDLEFETAADPFVGSGCVAYLLKVMGKRAIGSDFLNVTVVLASATIANGCHRLDGRVEERVLPRRHSGIIAWLMRHGPEIARAQVAHPTCEADQTVLLLAHGGPALLDDIAGFLRSVTGRVPSAEAIERVTEHYRRIGGKSPAPGLAESLARKLSAASSLPVSVAFLHSRPAIEEVVSALARGGFRRVLAICLAPQFSEVGIGPYQARAEAACARAEIELRFVHEWYGEPGLCAALADSVADVLWPMGTTTGLAGAQSSCHVVFTAHSLPLDRVSESDPYQAQVWTTAHRVARRLGLPPAVWSLAYQGAAVNGDGWLGPSAESILAVLAEQGTSRVVVCPIGFVLDQVETLYDLDIVLREHACKLGIELVRARALNDGPHMVETLAGLVRRWLGGTEGEAI